MRTVLLLLLACLTSIGCFAQTGDSTETFEPAPLRLHFASFETADVSGQLAVPLVVEAQTEVTTTGYQGVSDNKGFFSYDDAEMRKIGGATPNQGLAASQTATFYLKYDPSQLPFYPVRVQVAMAYTPAGGGAARPYQRDCYVYFTPYHTVEVWDQTDYENLRRMWLTDDGQPSSARVELKREAIPVSDIPANYQAAAGEEFDMEFVPGLAYAVPKLYPNFQGYQDGTGNNPPPPYSASKGTAFQFLLFKGQISNQRISTYHQPDNGGSLVQLPLRRGRVEVWWDVRGGSDQHVKTFYTDSEGYLTENGSRTVQFAFNVFGFGTSAQPEQVYLRIKMQDQWNMNAVWGPSIISFPLTTDTPRQLLAYNASPSVYPSVTFGQATSTGNAIELPETQGLKPFTWVMACRDQVWNALNGHPLQATRPVVVLLTNNPDDGFYRTSDRAIRLGANTRTVEFVTMHELGHFVMHDLTKASVLPGPGGQHTGYYNNHSPGVTITEGFADGFAFIMDEMTYQDLDRESGRGHVGILYHNRLTFGGFINPNLTSPFVSELTLGEIMLDLWDGPNNLAAVNNPLAPGFYEDAGDASLGYVEQYEMPLSRILSPLFYTSRNTISEYFAGLLGDNATNAADNQRIRDVWYYNFNSSASSSINTMAFKVLNMDEIDPAVTFTTPKFTGTSFPGNPDGTITNTYRNTDIGVLNGPNDSFNVTTYVRDEYDTAGRLIYRDTKNANGVTLTDPVLVTNGAELGLHSGAQPRWQSRTGGLVQYTKRTDHLEIALRAQARITLADGTRSYIGSVSPYQTTSVSLYEDTYIVVEKGATLKIEAGSTLNVWEKGTLLVRNGGTLLADGNVRLSPSSTLYVDAGAQMGVRPGVGLPTGLACTNELAACGTVNIDNRGVINTGSRNEALQFDGNDAVTIPNTNSLVNTSLTQQFAVEVFLRASNLGAPSSQTLFSSRHYSSASTNGYDGMLFSLYGGRLLLQLDGRNYYSSATAIPNDNACHHVAVTRDNANRVRFYVDGQESSYSPTTAINAHSGGDLNLGADRLSGNHGEFFQGLLGEVRVWNTWRSGDQIRQNRTAKLAAPQAGLVAYYDMQDASQALSDLSGLASTGQPAVPGVLGATSSADVDDPTWVAQCALTCTVQGNFRASALTWTAPDSTAGKHKSRAFHSAAEANGNLQHLSQLSLSPNPASGEAVLHFQLRDAGPVTVHVRDLAGLARATVPLATTVAAGAHDVRLPLYGLRPGVYAVVVDSADGRQVIRLEVR